MGFKGRFNVYTCPKGHNTVTKDIDDGVTPMFLMCRASSDEVSCRERAVSNCYPAPPAPEWVEQRFETHGWEWYRPSLKWARRKGLPALNHIERGGLVLRRHEALDVDNG